MQDLRDLAFAKLLTTASAPVQCVRSSLLLHARQAKPSRSRPPSPCIDATGRRAAVSYESKKETRLRPLALDWTFAPSLEHGPQMFRRDSPGGASPSHEPHRRHGFRNLEPSPRPLTAPRRPLLLLPARGRARILSVSCGVVAPAPARPLTRWSCGGIVSVSSVNYVPSPF